MTLARKRLGFLATSLAATLALVSCSAGSDGTSGGGGGGNAEGSCPAMTVADDQGIEAGAYPQQYDLAEYQEAGGLRDDLRGQPRN
jgi:hypothetical protein